MNKIKHRTLFFVLLFSNLFVYADPPFSYRHKRSGHGTRIHLGTGLSFYTINENHGSEPKQSFNGTLGFRRELRMSRDYRAYILFGMDYVFHGLKYKSYFFQPDSIKIYDKKFDYDYSLYLNELQFPLQFKYLIRPEDNSPYSPYFIVGYHLRYMLPGILKVSREDVEVKNDIPETKFKTFIFSDKINASVSAGLGWQKNNMSDRRGSFFGELNFQYGFSSYFFETNYSAASMFINSTRVTLLLGMKI